MLSESRWKRGEEGELLEEREDAEEWGEVMEWEEAGLEGMELDGEKRE